VNIMSDFKVGQLTKELVAIRLRNMGDPCSAAAELVKKTLLVALKGVQAKDPQITTIIRDACEGGLTGLLVAEQSLPKGAVKLMEAVSEVAMEMGLDPMEAMQAALEGFADLYKVVTQEQLDDIRRELGTNFMGTNEAFSAIVYALKERDMRMSPMSSPKD